MLKRHLRATLFTCLIGRIEWALSVLQVLVACTFGVFDTTQNGYWGTSLSSLASELQKAPMKGDQKP